jgi:hypothetical protein
MAWAGHITCTESYSDTLKSTDHLGDTTYEDVDLVHLAEERRQQKACANTATKKLRFLQETEVT